MFWLSIAYYAWWRGLWPGSGTPAKLPGWVLAATALCLHGWHYASINAVVTGGWSIAVEMTFYAAVPLLARLVTTRRRAALLLAVAAPAGWGMSVGVFAALATAHPRAPFAIFFDFARFWFPMQFPVFAGGLLLFFLVTDAAWMARLRRGRRPALLLGGSLGGLLALSLAGPLPFWLALGKALFLAAGLGGVVLALAARPYGLFVNPATRFLGRISFSVYLLHFAVFYGLNYLPFLHRRLMAQPPELGALAVRALLALPIVTAASYVTYRWVELLGIALGRRLTAWLESAP